MFKKKVHLLLAFLAYWYYGRPSRKLIVIGVTGTKGKSSTCRLITSVLEAGGYKVGLLSTVEFQIAEKRWLNDKKMTMLGRGQIQKMLRQMVKAGCRYAVIETSSEGIMQYRHYGLHYDIAVFTNLGTEHSERHGGIENLKRDKGKLFASLTSEPRKVMAGKKVSKIIIANVDDPQAEYFLDFEADEKYIFGINNIKILKYSGIKTLFASDIILTARGLEFKVNNEVYNLNIIGKFNVYNALAAVAVGLSQGITSEKIAQGLQSVRMIEGRMEFIEEGQPFKVVIDYAHEPLSLTALLTTLRELVAPANRKVIVVVGSDGGGRDVGKRPKMGQVAGEWADFVVITDVNCFDEDPREIAEMLAAGARRVGKKDEENLFISLDRREGIRKALSLAKTGDVVAITAKGTEPYMAVAKGKKIPWDDRKVAREILREMSIYNF